MSERKDNGNSGPPPGLSLSLPDIYHIFFRHKWMILFFALAGFAAAGVIYIKKPPLYTSAAKLYVRYVPESRPPSSTGSGMGQDVIKNPDSAGQNIITSEIEILTSLDLAKEVADIIGPEKILAKIGGGTNRNHAAGVIKEYLAVDAPRRSDVFKIIFQHKDRDIVQPVLAEVINVYFKKHAEIHRGQGLSDSFLTNQIAEIRAKLTETEQRLRDAKAVIGVSKLEDAKKAITERISGMRNEIMNARADLAQHEAALNELMKLLSVNVNGTNSAETEVPPTVTREHRNVSSRLELLYAKEQELLVQFTTNTLPVQEIRQRIADAERTREQLEEKYPRLVLKNAPPMPASPVTKITMDPTSEAIQVQSLKPRIAFLESQLEEAHQERRKIEGAEATIVELERRKELEETQFRYFSSSLEQARFNEALTAGKLSNISVAQAPSPPGPDTGPLRKMLMIAMGGGVFGGIALAFLIELFLDQTVRRPVEVETRLRLPLFLTIPSTGRNHRRKLLGGRNGHRRGAEEGDLDAGQMAVALRKAGETETEKNLRPFIEVLRDRLFTFFEANKIPHKPKLVAVTSVAKGAGVTTIASGLAATLSETGDGNVLLVDMNQGNGVSQSFFKGKPTLTEALDDSTKAAGMVNEHLYVATEDGSDRLPSVVPRLSGLVPQLRASDYDYIIFDMPMISQISVSTKMARMMDVNLMVVEAEKTQRDLVKQAHTLLAGSKSNVGIVLNKKRTYVPKWLHQEL